MGVKLVSTSVSDSAAAHCATRFARSSLGGESQGSVRIPNRQQASLCVVLSELSMSYQIVLNCLSSEGSGSNNEVGNEPGIGLST